MASLYFYYSAMNAGKTTTLLQAAYNYRERGMKPLLLAPRLDNRFADTSEQAWIASRIGLQSPATAFEPDSPKGGFVSDPLLVQLHGDGGWGMRAH